VSDNDGRAGAASGTARKQRLLLHVGLFLGTFLTTTATGALHVHGAWTPSLSDIAPISDGLSYSLPLMLILLCHELGHYFVARRHGVDASLPFFIPLPPGFGLGTLGAVIGMRDVATDRKKLIDVGAAGPLAGLIVAIPVIIIGLKLSKVEALGGFGFQEGNSLLYALLKRLVTGAWLPDGQRDVIIHPMAFAGWAGLLVTMINLLPIGQLDGGHIASAYFGNGYNRFARRLHRLLPLGALAVVIWAYFTLQREAGGAWNPNAGIGLAVEAASPWVIWYVMVSLMRVLSPGDYHPPVDDKPLPRSRRGLFGLMVVVFAVVFMPVPMRATLAGLEARLRAEEQKAKQLQEAQAAQQKAQQPAPAPAPAATPEPAATPSPPPPSPP
jgi:membrane-associated protease RseP (regulator of RpoE activity)